MATRRAKALLAAEKLVKKGRLEAAIQEFRKVLKEAPDDTRTLNRVGDLYARLNRVDEAVELFSQAAERFTTEGFFVKAIAIYKKILRLDPTRMPVYRSLAELYQQQGLTTEARAQYQVVADYYEKSGDSEAVLSIYERLAELEPNDHEINVQLADLLAEAKRGEEALALYGSIAAIKLDAGATDEALSILGRAVELVPESLQFVMQTVVELQARELPQVVERFLAKAEEHNPQAAEARGLLEQVAEPEPLAPEAAREPSLEEEPISEARAEAAAETELEAEVEAETEGALEVEEILAVLEESTAAETVDEAVEVAPEAPELEEEPAAEALETDEFEIDIDAFEEIVTHEETVAAEPGLAPAAPAAPAAPTAPRAARSLRVRRDARVRAGGTRRSRRRRGGGRGGRAGRRASGRRGRHRRHPRRGRRAGQLRARREGDRPPRSRDPAGTGSPRRLPAADRDSAQRPPRRAGGAAGGGGGERRARIGQRAGLAADRR